MRKLNHVRTFIVVSTLASVGCIGRVHPEIACDGGANAVSAVCPQDPATAHPDADAGQVTTGSPSVDGGLDSSPDGAVQSDGGLPDAGFIPADPTLRTVAEWEELFLQTWERQHTDVYLPLSTSGNSWRYYNLAYAIDGLTAMFEATGKTQYLDRALLYVENMIGSATLSSSLPDSQYKDAYLAWPASDHPTDPGIAGGEYPLFESYCWRYVARLLRVMRANPNVHGLPSYRQRYDDILAFTETHVFDKWMSRGANAHIYRSRTHMASHWAMITLNLSVVTESPARKAQYRQIVDNINLHLPNYDASLRDQMKTHPTHAGAAFWSDVWESSALPGQDVSHGNAVVTYIVEAYELGVEWGAADVDALVELLSELVWVRDGTGFRYAEYVDGSGTGNGWFNDGFCKLGRYDAEIQRRLETHAVGRGMQLYGNGALNARRLNGF